MSSFLAPSMCWYLQNWTPRFCYLLLHLQHGVLKCHVVHLANFLSTVVSRHFIFFSELLYSSGSENRNRLPLKRRRVGRKICYKLLLHLKMSLRKKTHWCFVVCLYVWRQPRSSLQTGSRRVYTLCLLIGLHEGGRRKCQRVPLWTWRLVFSWMQLHLLSWNRSGQSSKVWKVPGGESVCWSLESLAPASAPPAPLPLARAPSSWLPLRTCRVSPLCTAWLPDWLPRCLAKLCGAPDWRENGRGSGWGGRGEAGGGRAVTDPKSVEASLPSCEKTKLDLSANEF